MVLPVDNASIEDVPLESLPTGIFSTLRETAASPGTGSGDLEVASEPQSTEQNTATVNPEAPAIFLSHGQYNFFRRFTTKRSELVVIIVATCIALAALTIQLRANRINKMANQLHRQGNDVAENVYKLQLWEICHDCLGVQNSSICRDDSSSPRREFFARDVQHHYGEPDEMIILFGSMNSYNGSSILDGRPMDEWYYVGPVWLNVIICLVHCHVCYLYVLCDLPCRLNRAERREASSSKSSLWVHTVVIPHIIIALLSCLRALASDSIYEYALVILIGLWMII